MAIVISAFTAGAEMITVYSLFVNTQGGDKVEYQFADEPVATFEGENLIIKTAAADEVKYPMADVKNITFGTKRVNGIEEATGESDLVIRVTRTAVSVIGLADGAEMAVYSITGQLMARTNAAEGVAEISTEGFPAGVYAVAVPGHAFKFVK